jgi:hypothetical protein
MSTLPVWLIAKNAAKPVWVREAYKRADIALTAIGVNPITLEPLIIPVMGRSTRPTLVQMPEIDAFELDDAPMWCDLDQGDYAPERCSFSTM